METADSGALSGIQGKGGKRGMLGRRATWLEPTSARPADRKRAAEPTDNDNGQIFALSEAFAGFGTSTRQPILSIRVILNGALV